MISLKLLKKSVVLGMIGFILVGISGIPHLHAGICELGMLRCVNDPVNVIMFTGGAYCLIGYTFCLKYIDK